MLRHAQVWLDLRSQGGSVREAQRPGLVENREEAPACSEPMLQADVWPGYKSAAQHHLSVRL